MRIVYHTRLDGKDIKLSSGTLQGECDKETINSLVNKLFSVKILASGRAVFVDGDGRNVMLYVTIDPLTTDKGKAAKKEHEEINAAQNKKDQELQDLVDNMINSYTNEELYKILKEHEQK